LLIPHLPYSDRFSPPDKIRKRGRPRKNSSTSKSRSDGPSKPEDRPSISNLIPGKRGPGRPKKNPPVLEPSAPPTDSENAKLSIVINELFAKIKSSSDNSSNAIQLKDLERILNDHKNSKTRTSKMDTIFSKSKKLTSLPNVAIVKPMQHLVKENKEDDEKQNKRGARRATKPEKDLIQKESKEIDNIEKDRRKSDREKKPVMATTPTKSVRPLRSKTEPAPQVPASIIKQAPSSIPSPVKPAVAVNYVKPMPPKNLIKKAKFLVVRHKHKKKSKKQKKNEKENLDRAWFLRELDNIICNLDKCSIDGKKAVSKAEEPIVAPPVLKEVKTNPIDAR